MCFSKYINRKLKLLRISCKGHPKSKTTVWNEECGISNNGIFLVVGSARGGSVYYGLYIYFLWFFIYIFLSKTKTQLWNLLNITELLNTPKRPFLKWARSWLAQRAISTWMTCPSPKRRVIEKILVKHFLPS